MIYYLERQKRILSAILIIFFSFHLFVSAGYGQIGVCHSCVPPLGLPAPGQMLALSEPFEPMSLRGITLSPENPLRFDFIIDDGNTHFTDAEKKEEAGRLLYYFLAGLTVPEEEMWVNLSPHEADRVVSNELGQTALGRDLLAQDYLLKQLAASLIYPEEELGQTFWNEVRQKAEEKYGITDFPVDTFNKVWIVPDEAIVYEHGKTVYIAQSRFKVLLDSDYQSLFKAAKQNNKNQWAEIGEDVMRKIIVPVIQKEVNEGKNFSTLRQIHSSLILAKWYKEITRGKNLLSKTYVNQKKISGLKLHDKTIIQQIYNLYMEAYRKGVFNYIREEYDNSHQVTIPIKYFSGGIGFDGEGTITRMKKGSVIKDILRGSLLVVSLAAIGSVTHHGQNQLPPDKPAIIQEERTVDRRPSEPKSIKNDKEQTEKEVKEEKETKKSKEKGLSSFDLFKMFFWTPFAVPLLMLISRYVRDILFVVLRLNTNVNAMDRHGQTLLHRAVHYNHLWIIKYLLKKNAHTTTVAKDGSFPLFTAVLNSNIDAVKALLNNGAELSIRYRDQSGKSPMDVAIAHNDKKMINLLIEYGAGEIVRPKQYFTQSSDTSIKNKDDQVGGIDLSSLNVNRQGTGVDIHFNPALIQLITDHGIDGFTPVILDLKPINSIMTLLGFESGKEQWIPLKSI